MIIDTIITDNKIIEIHVTINYLSLKFEKTTTDNNPKTLNFSTKSTRLTRQLFLNRFIFQ